MCWVTAVLVVWAKLFDDSAGSAGLLHLYVFRVIASVLVPPPPRYLRDSLFPSTCSS